MLIYLRNDPCNYNLGCEQMKCRYRLQKLVVSYPESKAWGAEGNEIQRYVLICFMYYFYFFVYNSEDREISVKIV